MLCKKLEEEMRIAAEARSCTGVLGIHPRARDIKIDNFSITFHGCEMLQDTKLELNCGRRYGLIGQNGCGKSTLLASLANREVPIPQHIDIFHLVREIPASDKTALQCVMEVDQERVMLETLAEELAGCGDEEAQDELMDVYDRLEELGADTAEAKAAYILHGLGFTHDMMNKKCRDFSGGWRMRIALARALFVKPHLLLLDEPTNHLDLDACVWLEEELKNYKRILVIISHSQNYIARFGHGSAKLARQAQSKEKTLAKMVAGGLTEKVMKDKTLTFYFPDCGKIPPPVIMVQNVTFRYNENSNFIYKNIEFGIDLDTRLALVGPNGAGKSTLLKLLFGELVRKIIGRYGLTGKQQVSPIRQLSDGQRCRVVFASIAQQCPHMLFLDEPTNHLDMDTIDALADAINDFEGGLVLVSHDFRLISQVADDIWICEKQTVTKWGGDIIEYKNMLKQKVLKENEKRKKLM
ncbi:ATP-binding cassette sub-family F member 2 [Armadillidium nasatum]|uniref:ATP-binding cassette sub-family F member 2 n=1 Tax=Armadillidium nasatum TaxID=96803 RepID=A0A5N5TEE4_9CRUS|nr:ATP-binding cassette sub-family F member 2 [Armadillidium nasatum]